jgi:hypothetical protein
VTDPAPEAAGARELFVRHARRDGRSVAVLRAIDYGDSCVIEAEVYPAGGRSAEPSRPGPYTFADVHQATAFMTEAVEALMVLGCDVHAQYRRKIRPLRGHDDFPPRVLTESACGGVGQSPPPRRKTFYGMQPVVTGSLWTSLPLTCSTTIDDAPQVQVSDRFAGAAPAATVRTTIRQAAKITRPRFIWLQRHTV